MHFLIVFINKKMKTKETKTNSIKGTRRRKNKATVAGTETHDRIHLPLVIF